MVGRRMPVSRKSPKSQNLRIFLKVKLRNDITNGKIGACWDTLISNFSIFRPVTSNERPSRKSGKSGARPDQLSLYTNLTGRVRGDRLPPEFKNYALGPTTSPTRAHRVEARWRDRTPYSNRTSCFPIFGQQPLTNGRFENPENPGPDPTS